MASGIYNRFKANLMNKKVDLAADNIKVALLDNSHIFSETDNVWADVSANEIAGTGYTTNGADLAGSSVTQAAPTKWDATDISWSSATFSAYHAVLYDDSTPNNDLICSFDFGSEQIVSLGTFTIQWHAYGIITLS